MRFRAQDIVLKLIANSAYFRQELSDHSQSKVGTSFKKNTFSFVVVKKNLS